MSFRAFVVGADYHLQFARKDAEQIAAALKKLHPIPSWWQETVTILQNWKKNTAITVANVLSHYLADKEFLEEPCSQILSNWKNAIAYQRKKGYPQICTDHILTALGHPHLRTVAARTAAGMLLHEKEQPGFLGDKLLQAAEAIVNEGIYPDWEKEAD